MSSSSIIPNAYPLGATSAYIAFLPINGGSIPFSSTNKASGSWKKFIRKPLEQRHIQSTTIAAIVSSESTTIEGSFVLKPTPTLQELLNGPLFQVAGIFEIDEPGWADKHDEYIAEMYL
jgi:hypothetical protein